MRGLARGTPSLGGGPCQLELEFELGNNQRDLAAWEAEANSDQDMANVSTRDTVTGMPCRGQVLGEINHLPLSPLSLWPLTAFFVYLKAVA